MKYDIIQSGSKGNATVINDSILIDCGVAFSALSEHYRKLKIVLLTHSHSDHFNKATIARLAKERPTLRFGCCGYLKEAVSECAAGRTDVYEVGRIYDYTEFKLSPVRLYHDVENCGYRLIFKDGTKMFYATDTAHLKGISAKGYDLYMIEANYGERELKERIIRKRKNGEYAYELNCRDRHLSEEQASEWLAENMSENSRYIFMHRHEEKRGQKDDLHSGN